MLIPHPLLGPRDIREFYCLGDACLLNRPVPGSDNIAAAFHEYVYLRDNRAGQKHELWFHEQGDRSWLVVTRDTITHEIIKAELAHQYILQSKGLA